MNEHKTPADSPVKVRRRALYTALIAAGALLVAAAIVLTVFFTVPREPGVADDSGGPVEEDPSGDDDADGEPEEPGSTEVIFALPVQGATVGTGYTFWYNSTLNRYNLHTGVDFKADAGTAVTAAYAGTVESVTDTLLEGGKVVIDHGNGLRTVYASVDPAAGLKEGDTVARGDVIGAVSAAADVMGNEYDEGSHLHFEVTQDGKAIDPVTYLDLSEK